MFSWLQVKMVSAKFDFPFFVSIYMTNIKKKMFQIKLRWYHFDLKFILNYNSSTRWKKT